MEILSIDELFEQMQNVGKYTMEIQIGDSDFAAFEISRRWNYKQNKLVPTLSYCYKAGDGNTIIPSLIPAMIDILCKLYPEYKQECIDKLTMEYDNGSTHRNTI